MWREIRSLLRAAKLDADEILAQNPGQAWEAAERVARQGARLIVAVGGDGTLHETLNGLMRGRPHNPPALVYGPSGTANVFARALGLPTTGDGIARLIIDGVPKRIDIGQVNDRYYATIAGVGFDAEVVGRADRWRRWIGSRAAHVLGIFATLATYHPTASRVALNGHEHLIPLSFLVAANTDWYGGGLHIAPGARVDDARLSIVYASALTRWETISILMSAFSGRHVEHPKVAQASTSESHVHGDMPLAIHADGEWLGRGAATFRVVPRALDLVMPQGG